MNPFSTEPGLVKALLFCTDGFPSSELNWVVDVEKGSACALPTVVLLAARPTKILGIAPSV